MSEHRQACAVTRALSLLALVASGCAVPPEAGFPEVQQKVALQTGYRATWNQGTSADHEVADALRSMLSRPLTIDGAVTVSLLNNPALQGHYEKLGVAQADLVEAGMLANPSLGAVLKLPTAGGAPVVEGGLGFDFLGLLTLAARERVASEQFEAVKLATASTVVGHIAEVKKAYYQVQAAQQLYEVDLAIAQAAQGAYDSAVAFREAGNINELQLAREQSRYEEARLQLVDSRAEVAGARESLNVLLGLWGTSTAWTIEETLRGIPADELSLDDLESRAIGQRFDLQAAKRRSAMLAHALKMAGDWGWLHGFDVGAEFEGEPDGRFAVGPQVDVELPIFNQGQAERARLRSQLRASYREATALAVQIRADIRRLRATLLRHRRKSIHYREVVIPLRERIVALAHQHQNFMLVGVFELLEEIKHEHQTYRAYIDEVLAYWMTRAELARVVGGKLSTAKPALQPAPKAPKSD